MHVYATGMNPADANAVKRVPRVAIFQAFGAMLDHIQKSGETVTWKVTRVGDPLPHEVDAVIVSVMLPRSLNCPYALGAIWAISEALRRDIPIVLYMTDWAFFNTFREFRSIPRAGSSYFSKKIGGFPQYKEDPDQIAKHGNSLIEVCEAYDNPQSPIWQRAQVLIPKYTNWGDVRIIQRLLPGAHVVCTMDPTPLFVQYLEKDPKPVIVRDMEARAKHWILPSLLTDDRWLEKQNLTWPVDRFGPKGFSVLESEREVHRAYNRRAGAICPPYPTVGSGWWRSRWIHSARTRSILLCDFADAKAAGSAYDFSGAWYESMDSVQLRRVAEEQRDTMNQLLQLEMDVLTDQIYDPFWKAGA